MQLRDDIRRLHFEIIRQMHLQQVEFLGLMEQVSSRQQSLEGRIDHLGTQEKGMKDSMLLM